VGIHHAALVNGHLRVLRAVGSGFGVAGEDPLRTLLEIDLSFLALVEIHGRVGKAAFEERRVDGHLGSRGIARLVFGQGAECPMLNKTNSRPRHGILGPTFRPPAVLHRILPQHGQVGRRHRGGEKQEQKDAAAREVQACNHDRAPSNRKGNGVNRFWRFCIVPST
jgi:hypothetical protein